MERLRYRPRLLVPDRCRGRVYITGDRGEDLAISVFTLDGEPPWKTTNGAVLENSYPGARSSCTYDDGKLYHLNAHGRLVCLDAATGGEAWP